MLELNSPKRVFLSNTAVCLLGILLLINLPAWSQDVTTGRIRGTVIDASGAVVPGTSVIVMSELTNRAVRVKTDGNGQYDAVSLLPSTYSITFEKEGFKTLVRSGVKLETSAVIGVNVTLELGSVATKVVVQGLAPLVQTETAAQSKVFEQTVVMELPNIGGDEGAMLTLIPGVAPGMSGQAAGGEAATSGLISISGSTSNSQAWLLDGSFNTAFTSMIPDVAPSMENVAEFTMQLHDFSAEYGNGTASFNLVTKSGTNKYHGMLYEYVQNDKFNARNSFAQGVPPFRFNRYGGNIGGPIKKDKVFFFASYSETRRVGYSPSYYTVPTANEIAGNFSGINVPLYDPNSLTQQADGSWTRTPLTNNTITSIDPTAAKVLSYLPAPNIPGFTDPTTGLTTSNYYVAGADPGTWRTFNFKIDYNFSERNRLQVSEFTDLGKATSVSEPAPNIGVNYGLGHNYNAHATDVWTINSHMVNELSASYRRSYNATTFSDEGKGYPQKLGMSNSPYDAFPQFDIGGALSFMVGMPGWDTVTVINTDTVMDSLTWIKGKNNLKAGIEYNKFSGPGAIILPLQFSFAGYATRNPADPTSTGLGMADFLYGAASSWSFQSVPSMNDETYALQGYFLDDIKLRSNLTINLGVRYYNPHGYYEQYNRQANFSPTVIDPLSGLPGGVCYAGNPDHVAGCSNSTAWPDPVHQWQPRIGIAWSPKADWSVRAGYGMYATLRGGLYEGFYEGLGWSPYGGGQTTDYMTPAYYLRDPIPAITYPSDAARTPSVADNAEGGYYMAYEPSKMPWQYLQQYQVDVQHQFKNGVVVDIAYVGTHGNHMAFGHDINATPPADMHYITDSSVNMENLRPYPQIEYIYSAASTGWSNYNAFQASVKRHFTNGLFFDANYTWQRSLDTGTGGGWTSQMQVDSEQDASDVAANYGNARSNVPNVLSGAVVYQLPFGQGKRLLNQGGVANAIVSGWQLSSVVQMHSGVPFTPDVGTGDYSGQNALASEWFAQKIGDPHLSNRTTQEWFNTAAYTTPAEGTFGDAGRNSLVGPNWMTWDAGVARNIKLHWLGEGGELQIRADATDVTNRPNYGMPNNQIGAGAGQITSANTSRNIQLGARLTF
jgi:hypothetical protein